MVLISQNSDSLSFDELSQIADEISFDENHDSFGSLNFPEEKERIATIWELEDDFDVLNENFDNPFED